MSKVKPYIPYTPIFDSWPSPFDGGKMKDTSMPLDISGPVPRWGTLSMLAILGLMLIVGPNLLLTDVNDWHHIAIQILEGIGIATISSSVLGLTIERWLRADFARDIFLTAIGHHLPESYRKELRAELMRLSSFPLFCEEHILSIEIQVVNGTCVRAVSMIERTFRNISRSTQHLSGHIHIVEWNFLEERSRIDECKIEKLDGGSCREVSEKITTHDNLSISATTREINLGPNDRAKMTTKAVELKRHTDDLSFVFMRPTINPTINVCAPDGFEIRTSFGPDEERATAETYSGRRTLQGMYWPTQRMRIHWWTTKAKSPDMTLPISAKID
jgi:hypothetical protein